MRSKHRDQLQKIITDAEIEKIEKVQQKQKKLNKSSDEEDIEIIYYEENQQVELQNDVPPSDDDSESIELITILEEDDEETPTETIDDLKELPKTLPVIVKKKVEDSKSIKPGNATTSKVKEPTKKVEKKITPPKKVPATKVIRAKRQPYKRKAAVMETEDVVNIFIFYFTKFTTYVFRMTTTTMPLQFSSKTRTSSSELVIYWKY